MKLVKACLKRIFKRHKGNETTISPSEHLGTEAKSEINIIDNQMRHDTTRDLANEDRTNRLFINVPEGFEPIKITPKNNL